MTEYWKSQAKKFCDFCKCWISDNKASITFHETGQRHKQAVENRLYDIKRKGRRDEVKASREQQWLKEIEQKAMRDYRNKDLGNNADITAKIFNQKRGEREEAGEALSDADKARAAAEAAGYDTGLSSNEARSAKASIGPQIPSTYATTGMLRKIEAPTEGTKWHNEPGTKKWYEAKDDGGNSYYWHVETNESRWDAPSEGYLSLREQNKINKVTEQREQKRREQIQQSQALHGPKEGDPAFEAAAQGPAPRADPYGAWETVDSSYSGEAEATIDYQAPQAVELPQASVTMHSDKLSKFEEKKTPSLGGASTSSSKPAIVFRKRKVNDEHRKNARRREDDD